MSTDPDTGLRELRHHVAWVEPGDLVVSVGARLTASEKPRRRTRRRVTAFLAAVVVAAGSGIGPVRTAVADLLGFGVVELDLVERLPAGLSSNARLGRLVTLEEARRYVTFTPRLPILLGAPDEAFVGSPPGGLTLVWRDRGVLVTQHPGDLTGVEKTIVSRTRVQPVTVDGELGLWLEGDHAVTYVRSDGTQLVDPPRLAPNTLVWSRAGVVIRIETAGSRDDALALAASLRAG